MVIAALFKATKKWKQRKCPSVDEWKCNVGISTVRCYSAMKRDQVSMYATTWLKLETCKVKEARHRR